ncbi:MAG: CopG family transcriptional regulator [Phycisphaerales bacterium]|nr:MAG: CopG family transcriptional regulator [Phycisphaerales bacterium]
MKAREFDRAFDASEDTDDKIDWDNKIDWSKVRRPNVETRRVNVDFPAWVVESLDREARRLGVTRQSLIETWIAERLG